MWRVDWIIVGSIATLCVIGLLLLSALAPQFFVRQAIFAGIGIVAMLGIAQMDLRAALPHLARYGYFGALILLFGVLLFGVNVRGTVGWIVVGPVSIQVVEVVKVVMVLFLAAFLTAKQTVFGPLARIGVSLVLMGAMVALILLQPDFGSAMVLVALWFGMLWLSGMRRAHVLALLCGAVVAMGVAWTQMAPYQQARILTFIDPYRDPRGSGYNVIQAMTAIGSGGITGKGIGAGTQAQLGFLPEAHTDFIIAVVAEELGLIGFIVVMALYGALLVRIMFIALRAPDNRTYLIAGGAVIVLFTHIVINVGMNMGVMPVTGIPLPFLSYGGSALVMNCVLVGIVLSFHAMAQRSGNLT